MRQGRDDARSRHALAVDRGENDRDRIGGGSQSDAGHSQTSSLSTSMRVPNVKPVPAAVPQLLTAKLALTRAGPQPPAPAACTPAPQDRPAGRAAVPPAHRWRQSRACRQTRSRCRRGRGPTWWREGRSWRGLAEGFEGDRQECAPAHAFCTVQAHSCCWAVRMHLLRRLPCVQPLSVCLSLEGKPEVDEVDLGHRDILQAGSTRL